MSEIALISDRVNNPIAMAMTGAALDGARRTGVVRIEADLAAMAAIAHELGVIATPEPDSLPSLLLVARDTARGREYQWDTTLPLDEGDGQNELYFSVHEIGRPVPRSGNREVLVRAARDMGATALTEISIGDWADNASHVRAFGMGLVTGQRPLDLPPARSTGAKLLGTAASVFDSRGKGQRRVDALARRKTPLAPPFIVTLGGREVVATT